MSSRVQILFLTIVLAAAVPFTDSCTHSRATRLSDVRTCAPCYPHLKPVTQWKAMMSSLRPHIKACFIGAALKDKTLQVAARRLVIRFTVVQSGHLRAFSFTPPVGSGFESCMTAVLRNQRLRPFAGKPLRFKVRMNLRPR